MQYLDSEVGVYPSPAFRASLGWLFPQRGRFRHPSLSCAHPGAPWGRRGDVAGDGGGWHGPVVLKLATPNLVKSGRRGCADRVRHISVQSWSRRVHLSECSLGHRGGVLAGGVTPAIRAASRCLFPPETLGFRVVHYLATPTKARFGRRGVVARDGWENDKSRWL